MPHKKHPPTSVPVAKSAAREPSRKLEIILKGDSVGSLEAALVSVQTLKPPAVALQVIHSGVGPINKSDVARAATGSRLVVGFNVEVLPGIQHLAQEQGVEVRLFSVIYRLISDLQQIAANLVPTEAEEKTTGKAKVIALFKSSRKGIILGCEIVEGHLAPGNPFRVITAMGPVYTGRIESLQIETKPVKEARSGQQVGLKIDDFNQVKLGDWVECFTISRPKTLPPWTPRPGVFRFSS
jgi:translation initiation factor IF-2